MEHIAPDSSVGNSFLSKAALTASDIWSLDREANITSVFLRVSGRWDRAAGGLKQIGARTSKNRDRQFQRSMIVPPRTRNRSYL
jgi:hypothetical protein